ncbi:hypothetical protein GGI04_000598 [Coemansia thaxteri]|uniref:Anaphase-promoting complex subunit 7 n=1 Tax=Coemansia thaxteri TaxID=2663907 RepID=A0A9W8BP98_9FUNG|nr:hypothetical protein H4R26_000181 [Coemansia thaxteri]KAJ2009260.1 hypothetical protein GGI04_000598 [Coemansia thaxteri]KAJ2473776.1 hypothetical protein GGI02_000606 [Coemansia sp. RSA 2322]KAJ2487903.1 hypothetical protein EV174_000250 [Coemansia sp. RSA 2320]
MAATSALVDEITQLVACDLGESALQLAELECRPHLTNPAVPAAERLQLARAYAASLRAQQQHRAALRATADFVAAARGQLPAADVEAAARDMADMRWALGEVDLCLAQLRQIPRAHRTTRDWTRMARCAAALNQHGDAATFYAEVLRAQPNAAEALAACAASADPSAAAVPGSTNHDVAAVARAMALMRRFDYASASSELRRLARRHRSSARIVALQATCRFNLSDDRGARVLFERALAMGDTLFDEMGVYAALLARTADRLGAYTLGRRLLRADATRAEGWVAMARYLELAGRAQDALAVAWKAQALAPRLPDAFLAEGAAQLGAGSAADAATAFARAHALAPSAYTYASLVNALVLSGQLKEAFVYAREAAELMPRHPAALAMVGSVLAHSPESADKAERLLTAALDLDRRNADAVSSLAALFVATGRVPDAAALLERHLPEIPTDDMHTRYADVLTLANDLPQAAVNYAAALHMNPDNQRARAGYERVDRLMNPHADSDDADDNDDDDNAAEDAEDHLVEGADTLLPPASPPHSDFSDDVL